MGWILQGYTCQCGNEYEELKDRKDDQQQECPRCGWVNKPALGGKVAAYSAMSREFQTDHMKNRSLKHSAKLRKADD